MSFMDEDLVNRKESKLPPKPKKTVYKTFDDEELVHMDKTIHVEGYDDFKKESYPNSLNFYYS